MCWTPETLESLVTADVQARLPEVVAPPSPASGLMATAASFALPSALQAALPALIRSAIDVTVGVIERPIEDWELAHRAQIRSVVSDRVIEFLAGLVDAVRATPA